MSTPAPTPGGRRRDRKAPEPVRHPLRKPKGVVYTGVTGVLALLFVITFVQACGSAGAPAPSSSPSASPSLAPSPSAAAPASAAASPSAKPTFSSPPPMTINTSQHYTATIDTEKGQIVLDLDPGLAPQTVNNFVFLAKQGFYDGLKWHRVVPDFVIQGGDPMGTGQGSAGYKFSDELPPKGPYREGCVAMANSGPNTNGSQFFICSADDTQKLQPNYNLFGYVKTGMDVVKKITTADHMTKVTIS